MFPESHTSRSVSSRTVHLPRRGTTGPRGEKGEDLHTHKTMAAITEGGFLEGGFVEVVQEPKTQLRENGAGPQEVVGELLPAPGSLSVGGRGKDGTWRTYSHALRPRPHSGPPRWAGGVRKGFCEASSQLTWNADKSS